MRKFLLALAALAVACGSAAIGWFGVRAWQDSQQVAAPTPDPTAQADPAGETLSLTFDATQVAASGEDLFTPPACGETWTPPHTEANGVLPKVDASLRQVQGVDTVAITPGYTTDTAGIGFLASEGSIIVTRDDAVVTPEWGGEFVPEYYVAFPQETTLTQNNLDLTGSVLCDVASELGDIWDDIDWSNATDDEIAEAQRLTEEFNARHETLPAGTYRVYQYSPIILGEPAAIARVLNGEGLTGLANLSYTAGYTALYADERVSEHCTELQDADGNVTDVRCEVPQDVLAQVLLRDVPAEFVADVPPAVAFSIAAEFTVE